MKDSISAELLKQIEADEKTVAAKLKLLRLRAGIELDDFAEALGIDDEDLIAFENGKEAIPASVIALACALSGVPFGYFFDEEDEDDSMNNLASSNVKARATEEQYALLS